MVQLNTHDGARQNLEQHVKAILEALLEESLRIKQKREQQLLEEIKRSRQEELRWEQ